MVHFTSNTGVAIADIIVAFPFALEYELSEVARFTVIYIMVNYYLRIWLAVLPQVRNMIFDVLFPRVHIKLKNAPGVLAFRVIF